jgi:hypothetical protein
MLLPGNIVPKRRRGKRRGKKRGEDEKTKRRREEEGMGGVNTLNEAIRLDATSRKRRSETYYGKRNRIRLVDKLQQHPNAPRIEIE